MPRKNKHIRWSNMVKCFFDFLFILGTFSLILLSLSGYLGELNRYLELISHFKLQYFILSFCPLFFFILRKHQFGLAIALLCLLINLAEIFPWYLPQSLPHTEANGQKIRVFQSNVWRRKSEYSEVISLVRKEAPDVAIFVEVGKSTAKQLEVLHDILPYSIAHQDVDKYGTAIFSKLPLSNETVKSLGGGRKNLLVDVTINGQVVSIISAHSSNPALGEAFFAERNQQLKAMANYVDKVNKPLVLAGDFNITMWSPFYKDSFGKVGLRNTRAGSGILPTWPTFFPLLSIPIDHCFVSKDIKVLQIRQGSDVGSDHLPLITDLWIPG